MHERTRLAMGRLLVAVALLTAGTALAAEAPEQKSKGFWTDDKGLTWTTKDDGVGSVQWHEAGAYCRALELGGFKDWRLPSIEDLERMYDGALPEGKLRARPPLELSRGTWWIWSGTMDPSDTSQAWFLSFLNGKRYSVALNFRRDHGRVLCVRRAKE